ncbi:MAG: peptidyl-prolyl cis-trans isomerase [Polyangiaceae bacterium]|nr:peptidyl-prolyl cis-trans isomerase [Polyangiaceae bacterium]
MWRTLAGFFLIGLVLLGARRAWRAEEPPGRARLVVHVAPDASAAEVERAIDDAVLAAFAARAGWARHDPVVRDRLVRNVRFVEPDAGAGIDDDGCVARALALGMDASDPVVRSRLVWLGREVLARLAAEPPSDDALGTYLAAHPDRFLRPAAVRFLQVLVGAERHGVALADDAAALGARLATLGPDEGRPLSDPSVLPAEVALASERRIDALFGLGFGAAVLAAPEGRWAGPLRSSYGLHFVWVRERAAGVLPALADVRSEVRAAYDHDAREAHVRQALRRLRAAYAVELARP